MLVVFAIIKHKVPHLIFSTADGSKRANVVANRLRFKWRRYLSVFGASPVLMQRKINRPLMKLLNHKPVGTADQRLRGSQT